MAILSAYSRRNLTTTAELPREHQMNNLEKDYFEGKTNSNYITVDDEDSRRVEKSAEEDSTESKCRTSSCVEINMKIQEIPTEESSLYKSVERINSKKEEIPKLDIGLISEKDIPQNAAVHLEILLSRNNDENNKKLIEKSPEVKQCKTSKSQTPRKELRGDSRDSGIGDCNSTIHMTSSSLQIDELGLVSAIEEEVDYETYNRKNERILKTQDTLKDRRSSTMGILENLTQNEKILPHETASTTCVGKVATKNDVTKTACETNPMRKATNENTDARILSNRDKFLPTGNVSRTAKIFERESGTSKSESSQIPAAQRMYPIAIVPGNIHNERIQKAFAFWNK